MPERSVSGLRTEDVGAAPVYPADLTLLLQTELSILAAIDAEYADKRHRLENWVGPQMMKEQLARKIEVCHKRDREPHVLRLGQLHEQIMNLTMLRGLHT